MDAGPAGLYRRDDIEARVVLIATPLRLPKSPLGGWSSVSGVSPGLKRVGSIVEPPGTPERAY